MEEIHSHTRIDSILTALGDNLETIKEDSVKVSDLRKQADSIEAEVPIKQQAAIIEAARNLIFLASSDEPPTPRELLEATVRINEQQPIQVIPLRPFQPIDPRRRPPKKTLQYEGPRLDYVMSNFDSIEPGAPMLSLPNPRLIPRHQPYVITDKPVTVQVKIEENPNSRLRLPDAIIECGARRIVKNEGSADLGPKEIVKISFQELGRVLIGADLIQRYINSRKFSVQTTVHGHITVNNKRDIESVVDLNRLFSEVGIDFDNTRLAELTKEIRSHERIAGIKREHRAKRVESLRRRQGRLLR